MTETKVQNFDEAVRYIETEMPNALWSLSNILNPIHTVRPFGVGVGLTIKDTETEQSVYEKCNSDMLATAKLAVERLRRRNAGDSAR